MKLSSILVGAAAFLSGAVLSVDVKEVEYVVRTVIDARIEVRVDPAGKTDHVYRRIETSPPEHLFKRACAKNNCLRAVIARPTVASTFCATYTAATIGGVGPFTQCDSPAKLSSACSCQYPVSWFPVRTCHVQAYPGQLADSSSPTQAPTCLADGASCTLANSATCCGGCAVISSAEGTCTQQSTSWAP